MPYLSASAVVIHYKEALYQVYAPLPFTRYSYLQFIAYIIHIICAAAFILQ